jgi:threonine synthase
MDIQVASNFERYLYYRLGEDAERLRALMQEFADTGRIAASALSPDPQAGLWAAGGGTTPETLDTIRRCCEEHGYLLDPHTAVGVHVGRQYRDPSEPMICLATAHPAKFGEAIRQATGRDLAHHERLDGLKDLPARMTVLPASAEKVREFLEAHV